MGDPNVAAIIAVPIIGAALTAYALRGRRTDDHPLCRRCGFDLFGMPEPTATPVGTGSVWGQPLKFQNVAVKGREDFKGSPHKHGRIHWTYGSD